MLFDNIERYKTRKSARRAQPPSGAPLRWRDLDKFGTVPRCYWTNQLTTQQTRPIIIPPGGDNKQANAQYKVTVMFFINNVISDDLREPALSTDSFGRALKTRLFSEY